MMFFKLLRFDIRHGLVGVLKSFAFIIIGFVFVCLDFEYKQKSIYLEEGMQATKTIGDFVLYLFGGMKEYIPSPGNAFIFPALWLLIFVIVLYSVLYYPYRNLQDFGKQLLVNSESRKAWWLAKCVWNIVSITLFFILIWVLVFIYSFFAKAEFSLHISEYMASFFEIPSVISYAGAMKNAVLIIFAPWFTSVAFALLQMTFSLFVKPVFGFVLSIIILLSSAYYNSFLLPGNFAMLIRSEFIQENGLPFVNSLVCVLTIVIVSIFLGMFAFKRYDILNKE